MIWSIYRFKIRTNQKHDYTAKLNIKYKYSLFQLWSIEFITDYGLLNITVSNIRVPDLLLEFIILYIIPKL